MSERNRRGGARRDHDSYRDSRGFSERQYGSDEPWREEQRTRHPDDRYGADRSRQRDYGHGYGYGFGDSSSYRPPEQPGRRPENYGRGDERRSSGGGEWERGRDRARDDQWDRDRNRGGFGSEFGAWRSGASFGFGREEEPQHETDRQGSPYGQGDLNTGRLGRGDVERDTDWMPNRPAHGRGTWAGDWSEPRTGAGEYGSQYGGSYNWDQDQPSGRPGQASMRDDYRGRSPKDYRRSDDRIREEICDRLTDDREVDPSEVTIKVESGEVTLTGFVTTRDQKRRAEESVERVSGVREVINQLRVSRADSSGQQTAQQSQQGNRGQRSSSTSQQSGIAADRER